MIKMFVRKILYSIIIVCLALNGWCNDDELKKYTTGLPFAMPKIQIPLFPTDTINIVNHGAVGNGLVMNTNAFAEAIETCASKGGGTVIVPAGIWLTGPIRLKSNINLHLRQGSVILFSPRFEDFPLIQSTWEGQEMVRCIAPISGFNLKNIAITGQGIIDGSGDAWRPVKRFKMTDNQWRNLLASGGVLSADGKIWWPSEGALNGADLVNNLMKRKDVDLKEYEAAREYLRPVLVNLVNCRNVLLDGPTFQNSPAWNIHLLMCENIVIRNITVRNPWYSQNGDGLDLESCRNVILYKSRFDVGDDAICLKSGKNEFGRKRGKPTENVVIDGCTVYHGHGGFTIGSEMSGGVRNISIRNCTFLGTDVGLRFKSRRGRGGVVENIYINNIYMKDIPTEAIRFNMFYDNSAPIREDGKKRPSPYLDRPIAAVTEKTPQFRNIRMQNIYCRGAGQAVLFQGLPEMALENIAIDNLVMSAKRGIVCVDADHIEMTKIHISVEEGPVMAYYNSTNVMIDKIFIPNLEGPLVTINGDKTGNIKIRQVDGLPGKGLVYVGKEVSQDALSWQ